MKAMKRGFLLAVFVVACAPQNTTPPEAAAEKFVTDLGLKIQGKPNCAGADTDNDGYVTCTIALANADGSAKTMSIQCAALNDPTGCDRTKGTKYAAGCKQTLAPVQVQTQ